MLEPDDRGFRQECYSWRDDDMTTGNFLLVLFQSSLFIQSLRGFLDKYVDQLHEAFPEDRVYYGPKGWAEHAERVFLQGYAAGLYKFADVYEYLITDPKDEYYRTIHILNLDYSDGQYVERPPGITKEEAVKVRVKFGQTTEFTGRKVTAKEYCTTLADEGTPEEHNVDKDGKKLNLGI